MEFMEKSSEDEQLWSSIYVRNVLTAVNCGYFLKCENLVTNKLGYIVQE